MPVGLPTAEEVKKAFDGALPGDRAFDSDVYEECLRGLLIIDWQSVSPGIETLDAAGVRLIRVLWDFRVDVMDTAAIARLDQRTSALRQTLDNLVKGNGASFGEIKFDETPLGKNFTIWCRALGIIH